MCQFIDLSTMSGFEQCWFKAGKCLHFLTDEKNKSFVCKFLRTISISLLILNWKAQWSLEWCLQNGTLPSHSGPVSFGEQHANSWDKNTIALIFACEMKVSLCINTVLFTIVFLDNGDLKRPHHKAESVTVGRAFICKTCNLCYNRSLLISDYSLSSDTFQKGNTFVWI